MSQMSGTIGDGRPSPMSNGTSTGRAVLLLAVAVVIGVGVLHQLDTSPASTTKDEAASTQANSVASTTVPVSTTLVARSPAEVKVLVANGVAVPGAASKVSSRLQPIGYNLMKPGNTTARESNSLVEYIPGYQAEAQAVATSLGIPASSVQALPTPSPVADLQGSNVLVIVGADLASSAIPSSTGATAGQAGQTQAQTGQGATSQTGAGGQTTTTVNAGLSGPLGSATGTGTGTGTVSGAGSVSTTTALR